jgi:hypothetical protein
MRSLWSPNGDGLTPASAALEVVSYPASRPSATWTALVWDTPPLQRAGKTGCYEAVPGKNRMIWVGWIRMAGGARCRSDQ